MRIPISASVLLLAPLAFGQTKPTTISPKAAATSLGNSNNIIPFSYLNTAYQQVHSKTAWSKTGALLVKLMRLRMARGFTNRTGRTIDLEMFMAVSPNSAANASATFANNEVAASRVNVFKRKMVSLPTVPNNNWVVAPFPFDTPFAWPGTHLSWRAIVRGTSTLFSYPLDAWSSRGSSLANGRTPGCKSAKGTRAASHSASISGIGGTSFFNGFSWVSTGGLPAILTLGSSATKWGNLTLPLNLTNLGAPGCFILNDVALTVRGVTSRGSSGFAQIRVTIPNNPALGGASFFSQMIFLQAGANALGAFTTNGRKNTIAQPLGITRIFALRNANATSGTLGKGFGLAIGLN